jgi:hypothetical protein
MSAIKTPEPPRRRASRRAAALLLVAIAFGGTAGTARATAPGLPTCGPVAGLMPGCVPVPGAECGSVRVPLFWTKRSGPKIDVGYALIRHRDPALPVVAYMPLGTLQSALQTTGQINNYWIRTSSGNHDAIDRTTARVEDALAAHGSQPTTMEMYVQKRDNVAANASMTGTITVLGLLIVMISLVGLVNAITMGVIERTREIGVLRCVGARAKDVRRIFRAEGVTVAVMGWLLGIPLGWAMAHGLVSATASIVSTDFAFVFPAPNIAITLAGTVLLAVLVLIAPLRRAVHLKPGKALRHT